MFGSNLQRRPFFTLGFGLLALWLVLEYYLFGFIAHFIGVFATIMLAIIKGGLGLVLLGAVLTRFSNKMRKKNDRDDLPIIEPFLAILGAILICIPGFLCSLIGLALFMPVFRVLIVDYAKSKPKSDTIELDKNDYHEER